MATAPASLKARALRWLAQREHSRAELRRKLLRAARADAADAGAGDADDGDGVDAQTRVDALLDWLERERHLSPARFVESRVNLRGRRHGLRRIEAELAEHGLALDAAQRAGLAASEVERARQVWRRRFGVRGDDAVQPPPRDAAAEARQLRFLLARGFAADVARRVVRAPVVPDEQNDPDDPAPD